ncbi:MAG: hypothetical protein WCJ69_07355 [Betaproteobacteria bacterium]|jgi:hypothetical protein
MTSHRKFMIHQSPPIIDVEASGFGRGSYPIEIGVVLAAAETHCFLIHPAEHWTHWDSNAESVHHISRDILLRHGKPVESVARRLNELLAGATIFSDAWGHDQSWVALLFEQAGLPQLFRIEALRGLLSDTEAAYWHSARAVVQSRLGATRHRASADAVVIQKTFDFCRQAATEGSLEGATEKTFPAGVERVGRNA